MRTSSTFTGFTMKSYAPHLRLSMAVFMSPTPVMTMIAASASTARARLRNSSPSITGILMSVSVSGGRSCWKASRPSRPLAATRHR